MDLEIKDEKRKVIPRWRDFMTTLVLGELSSATPGKSENTPPENSIDEQIFDWKNNRTLSFATDLVGSGFVVGMSGKVQDAAEFILSDESSSTELQKRIARQVKIPDYFAEVPEEENAQPNSTEVINHSREQVKKYREQLRQSPRNPVKLVELSRVYATLGSIKKALRAMDTAVALAPANRFVLRSATRLYVHADEIEKAHFVLRRAPSLRADPWLLSAEISIAALREQTSRNIKTGMVQIGDANYNPFEISELTSAIATLEMENANSKSARKLFRQALRRPTENSIAQAEWASHTISSLDIDLRQFDVPRNYEALASSFYQKGEMENAISQGTKWLLDQPFAVRPVMFTGSTAALLENFDFSEKIYRFGIRANPDNVILRNNLAYVLATNNLPEEAETEFYKIDRSLLTDEERVLTTATEGLIRFRQGLHEQGRNLYRTAIKIAQSINEKGFALRALMYLAREEVLAGTDQAIQTFLAAENEARRFTLTQELKIMFDKIRPRIQANTNQFKVVGELLSHTKAEPKLLK